jgi:hypothetical protein
VTLAAGEEAAEADQPRACLSPVARMARFGVRSGSLAFARPIGNPENKRLERTDANRSERSLAFAMQKVVGSSPIIRSS